jgi:hypothetical protein
VEPESCRSNRFGNFSEPAGEERTDYASNPVVKVTGSGPRLLFEQVSRKSVCRACG